MGHFKWILLTMVTAVSAGSCAGTDGADEPVAETDPPAWAPETACPGGPGCAETGDTTLRAGVSTRSIEPNCYESWNDLDGNAVYNPNDGETYNDCGCDQLCEGDDGWTEADDGEGDDLFQMIWLGGFQNGRPATAVRDESVGLRGEGDGIWARAIALEQGDTRIGIVSVDLVGYFYDEVVAIRGDATVLAADYDYIIVSSTHDHESPDMMGIWGPNIITTGYDPDYAAQVRATIAEALVEASETLTDVTLTVGKADVGSYDAEKGVANVIRDSRDPWVIDPWIYAARFADADNNTVVTLVNWANHPETVADKNTLLTSDFAHTLRKTVEEGSIWNDYSTEGLGGTCIFINGAVGGMMTSLGVQATSPDGETYNSASFDKADVIGTLVGEMALDAIAAGETVTDPVLSVSANPFFLPIDNQGFQAMFLAGVFGHRSTHNWDDTQPIEDDNSPELLTDMALINVGPIQMLSIPGELLPELAVGGYDGSMHNAPGYDFIDPNNENPPDMAAAPEGPYLKDRMTGEYNWIIGMGNDELGYIIPEYDFKVHDGAPFILEADGDHYEETNSLGPLTASLLEAEADRLIEWSR